MKKERYTFETLEDTNKVRETFRYDKESFDPRNNENFVYKHEANKLSKESNNSSLGKEENDELCYSKKRKKKEEAKTEAAQANTDTPKTNLPALPTDFNILLPTAKQPDEPLLNTPLTKPKTDSTGGGVA